MNPPPLHPSRHPKRWGNTNYFPRRAGCRDGVGVGGSFLFLYFITCFRAFWTILFSAILLVGNKLIIFTDGGYPHHSSRKISANTINLIFEPFPYLLIVFFSLLWKCLYLSPKFAFSLKKFLISSWFLLSSLACFLEFFIIFRLSQPDFLLI